MQYKRIFFTLITYDRFEPDMLAFSGCYFGGGEIERRELGAIRKRWDTLHVSDHSSFRVIKWPFQFFTVTLEFIFRKATLTENAGMANAL